MLITIKDSSLLTTDSLSGDYEDPFSLETFEDLCNSHFAKKSSFIIARVRTWDPKQPQKEFFSYYDAFHLNKTLFQTQIVLKKRYIHRLHVLNPLTNSDIVGHVEYFKVRGSRCEELSAAKKIPETEKESESWTKEHQIFEEEIGEKNGEFAGALLTNGSIVEVAFQNLFPSKGRKQRSLNYKAPEITPTLNQSKRVPIVPGAITQFGAQSLQIELPSVAFGNRRALSFRNAQSASNVPLSFLEWTAMVEAERRSASETQPFDTAEADRIMHNLILSPNLLVKSPLKSPSVEGEETFEAEYCCTDDDFLTSSRIRKLFIDNALDPIDSKLFEMAEYTGEEIDNLDAAAHQMCALM